MSCNTCRQHLGAWLRGELSPTDAEEVEHHVSQCYFCAAVVENEGAILESLNAIGEVPPPSVEFKQRVLAAAASDSDRWKSGGGPSDSRYAPSWSITGGAIAAALVLGIAVGVGLDSDFAGINSLPETAAGEETDSSVANTDGGAPTLVATQPQNVRLAFTSAEAVSNVTLTVELPSHVEMARYPGYHQLSWNVSLDKGENIVNLPLKVLFPGEGDLVAHLDSGKIRKTFRAHLSDSEVRRPSEPVL